MELQPLLKKSLPQMPSEIIDSLHTSLITPTPFEDKNDILTHAELQTEIGYAKMQDGSFLVSMTCPMPGVTTDMVHWWFWWHAQDSLRYQVWYPGEHVSIKYHKKNEYYFKQRTVPSFATNTHYLVERIGGMKMPLRIDFVTPEDFGFSRSAMDDNHIPLIVCGHVSAFGGLIKHTEMAHLFKQTDDGLFMISRFWLGKTLKSKFLRKLIVTEKMAREMAEHCCVEYRNLCEILPVLYDEYK